MFGKQLSTISIVFITCTIASSSEANQIVQPNRRRKRGGFFKPEAIQIWRPTITIGRGGSAISENDDNHTDSGSTGTPRTGSTRSMNTDADAQDMHTRTSAAKNLHQSDCARSSESEREVTQPSPSPLLKSSSSQTSQTFIPSQTSSANSNAIYPLSICSIQGKRQYMEDEYFTNQNGSFCSVMDGHGGSAVSRYLRQNFYARYLQAKASTISNAGDVKERGVDVDVDVDVDGGNVNDSGRDIDTDSTDGNGDGEAFISEDGVSSDSSESQNVLKNAKHILSDKLSNGNVTSTIPTSELLRPVDNSLLDGVTLQACIQALKSAFEKIDAEVQRISHWSFQGSTAVAVKLHKIPSSGKTVLISANVGDSRAILSRAGTAIDLTKDHKPNDPVERARIESLGGRVDWFGPVDSEGKPLTKRTKNGCYRINRNLALSRAIGDRSELPFVSSKVDIEQIVLDEENDEFIVLASDGLWDVFDRSQDVVNFCRNNVQKARSNTAGKVINNTSKADPLERVRRKMSKLLVREALRRGSMDNITVIIIWLSA